MDNMTTINIPKKYAGCLEEVYYSGDSYYAWANPLWVFDDSGEDIHYVSSETKAGLLQEIRSVKPCSCLNCISALKFQDYGETEGEEIFDRSNFILGYKLPPAMLIKAIRHIQYRKDLLLSVYDREVESNNYEDWLREYNLTKEELRKASEVLYLTNK